MIEVVLPMKRPKGPCQTAANPEIFVDMLTRVAERKDKAAFTQLFEHFGPRIKSFMMQKGADDELAEDLAQETMITAWNKAHLYSPEKGSVSTWMFTIARNRRIDWARRMAKVSYSDIAELEHPCDDPATDETIYGKQQADLVSAAVSDLPDEQQQVISLSFMEDLSQMEIAARLKLPLGTVKSRMRLAYRKLSKSLEVLQ